jgi:hypothetical protein
LYHLLCSAVMLVDSSRAGWPILHANAACQQLVQQLSNSSQQQQQQCSTGKPTQALAAARAGTTQLQPQQQQQQQCVGDTIAAAPAGDSPASLTGQPSPRCSSSSSSIVGKYIKDILDPLQIAYMRSTAPCSSSGGTMSLSMFLPNLPGMGGGVGMPGVSAAAAAAAAGWPLSFRQRVMLQTQVSLCVFLVSCCTVLQSALRGVRQQSSAGLIGILGCIMQALSCLIGAATELCLLLLLGINTQLEYTLRSMPHLITRRRWQFVAACR